MTKEYANNRNTMILAQDQYFDLDCYKTQLNNNVLVVGAAGSGKTRSIVSPNILQATDSYVITDPKGSLHKKYGKYLRNQGYTVRVLDFIHPENGTYYNFFHYIRDTQDIVKLARMLMDCNKREDYRTMDTFWEESGTLLLTALIGYLWSWRPPHEQTLESLFKLIAACNIDENSALAKTPLDHIFDEIEAFDPNAYEVKQYKKFRIAAGRTLRSILVTLTARLGVFDFPELNKMTSHDCIALDTIGNKKTAIFVIISDKDRSMDGLANMFYSQAMDELCRVADEREDGRLPVPVRFILDDFATNCKITDFPRMIASIRSRGISTMLMIQAESQLEQCYGHDGRTIIGNCDTYVYLGGNDLETAKSVAMRCDLPVKKILYMPVGTNWIFRRGQMPINGVNFKLEPFEKRVLKPKRYVVYNPEFSEVEKAV